MSMHQLHTAHKASKAQTRAHNRRLVLQVIAAQGESSRATIARVSSLTPPSVSSIVRDLLSDGLIVERGRPDTAAIGKPPELVGIAGGRYQIAVIDLSGRHFNGAIIDLDGTVTNRISGHESSLAGSEAVEASKELARDLLAQIDAPERRLCIATPGVVDNAGVVRQASYFDWKNLPLADELGSACGVATRVVNDGHALVLAEYAALDLPVQNMVALRIARGLSAGIILHGAPYFGDGFGAGEIGFLLPSVAEASPGAHRSTVNTEQLISVLDPNATSLTAAVESAAPAAVERLARKVGSDLGRALAALVGVLDIHTVRIDPSVAPLGEPLLEAINEAVSGAVVDAIAEEIQVRTGQAGTDAVLRGAALAVTHNDLGLV